MVSTGRSSWKGAPSPRRPVGRSGTLTDVIANPANDLWVARDDEGTETLVPALRDVIVEVDIEAKRVVVRDVPGLTIPDED